MVWQGLEDKGVVNVGGPPSTGFGEFPGFDALFEASDNSGCKHHRPEWRSDSPKHDIDYDDHAEVNGVDT